MLKYDLSDLVTRTRELIEEVSEVPFRLTQYQYTRNGRLQTILAASSLPHSLANAAASGLCPKVTHGIEVCPTHARGSLTAC